MTKEFYAGCTFGLAAILGSTFAFIFASNRRTRKLIDESKMLEKETDILEAELKNTLEECSTALENALKPNNNSSASLMKEFQTLLEEEP